MKYLLLLVFVVGAAIAGDYGPQKVVYQISTADSSEFRRAMAFVNNHIKAVGEEHIDLRIVFHSQGVAFLKMAKENAVLATTFDGLQAQGVTFNVCNNTLNAFGLDYKKDLYNIKATDIVPSGVGELGKLQMEGFAYIHP